MIKGISILRPAATPAEYEQLASFFSALGFAFGNGWDEEGSRGASFVAPMGNLEFVHGQMPSVADVLVEVTQLDAVREAALGWFKVNRPEDAGVALTISETHWKSRLFPVEPVAGHLFTFWEF